MKFTIQPFCAVLFIILQILFSQIKKLQKQWKLLASKVSGCMVIIFIAQEKVADFYEAFIVMSTMLEESPNKVIASIVSGIV